MSNAQNVLITLSLIAWFIVIIYDFVRYKRPLSSGIQIVLIFTITVTLNLKFGYFNMTVVKGGKAISEGWILFGLYVSTILGILGHHVFIQIRGLNEPGRQPKIKWMSVVKPLIISPIVFLAVLNQLEQIGAKTNVSTLKPVITQFILAFQNGFFWKTVIEQFERKRNETK